MSDAPRERRHSEVPLSNQTYAGELQTIRDTLLAMGARCEQMLYRSLDAAIEQDAGLANEIMSLDPENDRDELFIDELIVRVIALRQPVGRDLRFMMTAAKVVTDLERIGDEAVNLAERSVELASRGGMPAPSSRIPEMVERAGDMLREALDAFVDRDVAKARNVLKLDDRVDELYGQTLDDAAQFMKQSGDNVGVGLRVTSCAKYLERIADHATNIAEMVIYMVEGIDVRHNT